MRSIDISFPYSIDKTIDLSPLPTTTELNISKCAITTVVRELIDIYIPLLSINDGYVTELEEVKNLIKAQGEGVVNAKITGLADLDADVNLDVNYNFYDSVGAPTQTFLWDNLAIYIKLLSI